MQHPPHRKPRLSAPTAWAAPLLAVTLLAGCGGSVAAGQQ
jgi:hypothetical protein